ncbi:Hypothetical_protein [Hexamita inflata]|uniref:Hypothetical_protein n=1 Tax=Hexamita inflata TaxID=28002 RepID=A0AA86NGJ2_9EUKA|nr:Hypothetical protein HINF_LOCUS6350 [Hexamita inflata]
MAVYSTIWMPSWVIVSISLSCNVYFDSVRELEYVANIHEHLVTRGSFEAVVLVIGVADDVLLQVLDQLPDRLSLYCQETENVETAPKLSASFTNCWWTRDTDREALEGLEIAQAFPYDGNGVPTSVLLLEFQ